MSEETTTPDTSAPAAPKFKFGFVILVSEDGSVFVEKDPALLALEVERPATLLEIRRYTSEILMDLQAQSAAEYVTLRLAAAGKAAEEADKA